MYIDIPLCIAASVKRACEGGNVKEGATGGRAAGGGDIYH